MKSIPIARPIIEEEEIERVISVLKSGQLAQGEVVKEFEQAFSDYIGTSYAVAVCNGTVALDLALKAAKIGPGDEVITTPFSFISTANTILYQGAKPIFADIEESTFNINPEDVQNKITSKTKAVVGVHLFGHPFDVRALLEICEDYKLVLIEDCAQAHGAEYEGKRVGSFSIGCFSFYPTKNMTTGEGGMITTNDEDLARVCRLIRNHGEAEKYLHILLGYNYRMTNIQAAIGLAQLNKLDFFNEIRIKNAEYLNKKLKIKGLVTPVKKRNVKHVYHQYVIKVEKDFPLSRDELMRHLRERGIGCAIHYPKPIFEQPIYRELGYTRENTRCPISIEVADKVLSLPVHPGLTEEDLRYIVNTINNLEEEL
jgi:perosamine synthetase